MTTWVGDPPPDGPALTARTQLRILRRAVLMAALIFGGLGVLLALRPLEVALHGRRRPWTPHITRTVCRGALRLMGLRRHVVGAPAPGVAAMVANHVSWLDILVLNAGACVTFVSKSEVARWPGIGWLARATGTVFVSRDPRRARQDVALLQDRLALGQTLIFFPEGTSSDGLRVLPFKPTLFAPLLARGARIQPVTLSYAAPAGADPRAYGWWGDMDFGTHLIATLALKQQGTVTVTCHPVVELSPHMNRKTIAADLESTVRSAL